VRTFHGAIRASARQRLADSGGDWDSFVLHRGHDLITAADFERIEADLLATRHRFDVSAVISAKGAAHKYKPVYPLSSADLAWQILPKLSEGGRCHGA